MKASVSRLVWFNYGMTKQYQKVFIHREIVYETINLRVVRLVGS